MQMWLFSQASRCYFEHNTLLNPFDSTNTNVNTNYTGDTVAVESNINKQPKMNNSDDNNWVDEDKDQE